MEYISSLDDQKFIHSQNAKWTAGQQLSHVYLCLTPISQALVSKEFIRQKFGLIDRPLMGYDEVIDKYINALATGGKAPGRFVPDPVTYKDKAALSNNFNALLTLIRQQLDGYTDEELNTLILPHPLLGSMTIRELFYLMSYHATHHLRQTERNLVS